MTRVKGRWPEPEADTGVEDATLLILQWLGEQGVGAMIRVDAERVQEGRPAWTFAAGGGPRADGDSVAQCMGRALSRLREAGLDIPF